VRSHVATPDLTNLPKERVYRRTFDWDEINKKPILNRFELAFLLGVSQGAVDTRLGSIIPFFRIGGRVLIDKAKALAALEKLERKAAK
jgi:hypothetical protein